MSSGVSKESVKKFIELESRKRELAAQERTLQAERAKAYTPKNPLLKRNPMYPYQAQYSPIYITMADEVNRRPFAAVYPQTYAHVDPYYLENHLPPPFTPEEGEFSRGRITIAGMIALTNNREHFTLVNESDIPIILDICQRYREMMEEKLEFEPDRTVTAYLDQMKRFTNMLEHMQTKIEFGKTGKTHSFTIADFFKRARR